MPAAGRSSAVRQAARLRRVVMAEKGGEVRVEESHGSYSVLSTEHPVQATAFCSGRLLWRATRRGGFGPAGEPRLDRQEIHSRQNGIKLKTVIERRQHAGVEAQQGQADPGAEAWKN